MASLTRKTGPKGQVSLGEQFANQLVIVEQISDEEVRVRKARAVPKKSLTQLLAKITPENLHGEIQTGPAVGAETW
jgi:antitoxin component of MazEF toxin-antitoxin module